MPGPGRRFQRGQSGNLAGRPKLDKTITELARAHGPRAIEVLVEVMNDEKATATARAMAADRILDRAYGRAPQAIGVSVGGVGARPIADYSDEELSAIIAAAQPAPPEAARDDEQLPPNPKKVN
jgi:hypothetical protein